MQVKKVKDDGGCFHFAYTKLPSKYFEDFLHAIAELEDNDNHVHHSFPHTELHKVDGSSKSVYRAYISKISGWRIHLQYDNDGYLLLNEVLPRKEHDNASKVIKTRKGKYK